MIKININRVWAMPNKWTFQIKPIAELLARYVGDGKGWVDPFAGMTSPAEFTNDLNINSPAKSHLDAFDYVDTLDGSWFSGCIFDPPYSLSAVAMFYKGVGLKSRLGEDPTATFKKVKDVIGSKIYPSGYAISFGWNSNGFGKKRGFEIIEILLIAHGGGHNDTIITVEQKLGSFLELTDKDD